MDIYHVLEVALGSFLGVGMLAVAAYAVDQYQINKTRPNDHG